MGKYFSLIPTGFADEDLNKRFLSDIPSSQILQEEMTWMKEILSNLGSPVVLCHNDLLCKNIIYNEKQGRYLTLAVSRDDFFVLDGSLIFVSNLIQMQGWKTYMKSLKIFF
ncbi:ethanolamine kinase 1 [Rhinolophus ferrumequinum]|nr:ethanolamine kinase 1 [Rhinolophus ferrumequinum]